MKNSAMQVLEGNPGARLWLFDFDNTLAELEPRVDWAASRRELEPYLRAAGVADAIFAEIPRGNLPLYEALRARLASAVRGDAVASFAGDRVASDRVLCEASALIEKYELLGVDRAAPADGAAELLRALAARGSSATIVTSNSSRTVMRWLERHRMTAFVRTIVGRDSMLPLKPAPDMVGRGLELCATPAADAVFVGDSEADLRAACAAQVGFFGVAVRAELRDRLIAAGASLVFASPSALAIYSRLR